ncbi:MAG TPA: DDE-type integrase/transposase/recombinase [Halalkalibaculum sp.]|nr:DDE-type integrase/transposase/recombinase [Halalkalibaculum sp.]
MNFEEKNRLRMEIADFRYSVVAELCNPYLGDEQRRTLIQEKVSRRYVIPGSRKTGLSAETIRGWMRKYRLYGKEGLFPKQREDRSRPRSFNDEEATALVKILEEKPRLTAASAVRILQRDGIIESKISSSALSRFVKANNLTKSRRNKKETEKDQRRFSFEGPLECVQADAMHGFAIPDGMGKRRKAILLAFIDDATRRVLYARFAFSEKAILFEDGIKHILKAHGKIGRQYVDNGSTFISNQTKRILETLGIYLIHSKPYQPEGRGKIERFFRTVRQSWVQLLEEEKIQSLEELNHLFHTWLENEYHRKIHSALGVTPLDAWIAKCDRIKRLDSAIDIDHVFLHTTTRKVTRDSIVSLGGVFFEVPSILRGKTVDISYDPHPPLEKIEIRCGGKEYGEARLLDLYANTKIKRNRDHNESSEEQSEGNENTAGALL